MKVRQGQEIRQQRAGGSKRRGLEPQGYVAPQEAVRLIP